MIAQQTFRERARENMLLIVLAVLLLVAALFEPGAFYSVRNLSSILKLSAIISIAALGEGLIILVRCIDISVGAVMGFTSMCAAIFLGFLGPFPAIGLTLLLCALIGLCNGLLVVRGRIPPIVTTLGMMWLLRGIAGSVTGGKMVRINNDWFNGLASASLFDVIPYFFLGIVITAVITYFLLHNFSFGRHVYAVGGSEEASAYSGINIARIRILVFVIAAVLYGIAGLFMSSYIRVGNAFLAEGYEFKAITAVALGGIALSGGSGNILKAVLGAVILTILFSLIVLFGVSPYLQGIFEGTILIGAVWVCLKKP
jgi:ribose transport system permease protein